MSIWIEKTFGTTEFICDHKDCNTSDTYDGVNGYVDIEGAAQEAREEGWKIFKENGDWVHYCFIHNPDNKEEK